MKAEKINCVLKVGTVVLVSLVATACVHRAPSVSFKSMQTWKKVALVETMIAPPTIPVAPLVQAGLYRSNMNPLAADILKLHQERIDGLEETLGAQLAKNLEFEVLYGKELLKNESFKNIEAAGVKTHPTTAKGDVLKSITVPSRGYNFFDFSDQSRNPYALFTGKSNEFLDKHAASMAAICKALDVDSVAVALVVVETTGVNFIAQGSKRLVVRLTFFDRSGKLFYSNIASARTGFSSGGDLEAYKNMFEKYPEVLASLFKRVVGAQKPVTPPVTQPVAP
jgi:hypothetical protein